MEISKERLIGLVRLLATPIDIDHLIEDGVLAKSSGGWYAVDDAHRLPEHAWQQASEIKSETFSDGTPSKTYFKFGQGGAAAAKLYEQITGTPFGA